jgi:5'-nucleotidase
MPSHRSIVLVLAAVALALTAGCSDDEAADRPASTEATEAADQRAVTEPDVVDAGDDAAGETLRILVTNDDGVDSPGIDLLVEGLRTLPDVEVTVVAPLGNQSGSGGSTSEGALSVAAATTASGFPATAVEGYPADSIVWALDEGGVVERPHVVISGVNWGQNLGPHVDLSGTVGAARAAASRGIPALAVSQGFTDDPDYPASVALALEWVEEHRADLVSGAAVGPPVLLENLNVPTCEVGEVRGLREAPVAEDTLDRDLRAVDCTSTDEEVTDDIDGFLDGFAVVSRLAA